MIPFTKTKWSLVNVAVSADVSCTSLIIGCTKIRSTYELYSDPGLIWLTALLVNAKL